MFRPGRKYQHLIHGAGCACHGLEAQRLLGRIDRGLSRRSVLKGIAASLAAPALGLVGPAFAQTPSKPVLLTNVNIFDGTNRSLVEGRGVLVEGGFIKALVASADPVTDADVIDCGGRTLMPGMIDAHWHSILAGISQVVAMTADIPYVHLVAAQEAERTVLRGFTTVRDVGGPSFALKRAIDEGRIAGPRIYPSGAMISQTSGHGDFRMRTDLPRTPQSDLSVAERAGIAAIEMVESQNLLENVDLIATVFRARLEALRDECEIVRDLRIAGVMIGIELAVEGAPIVKACMERGLLINCTQGVVIRLLPAMNLTGAQVHEGCDILCDAIRAARP